MLTESVTLEKEKMYNVLNEKFNEEELKTKQYLYLSKIEINNFHQEYLKCFKELIKEDGINYEFLEEFQKENQFLEYLKENIQVRNYNDYDYVKTNLYLESISLENAINEKDLTILYNTVKHIKEFFEIKNLI